MKKTISILLSLCLLLALCACGGESSSPAKTEEKPAEEAPVEAAPAAEESAAEEPAAEEPAAEEPAAPALDENAVPLGELTETEAGVRYENRYLGIGVTLGSEWTVANEQDMAQIIGAAQSMFEGGSYEELAKNADMFYDLYTARDDGATMNLNFSDLKGAKIPDLDAYLEMMLPYVQSMLESSQMENVTVELDKMQFVGSERSGILMQADSPNGRYYAQQFYFVANGRIAVLTLGTFGENTTGELAAMFEALK